MVGVQVQVLKKTQGFYMGVQKLKNWRFPLWQCWEMIYNPIWPIVQFLLLFGRPTRWHVLKPQSSFGPGYDLNICRESGPWASGGHFRTDIELQISKERLPKEAAFKRNETWNSNDCGVLWYFILLPKSLTLWSPKSYMESLRQNSWLSWQSHNTSSRAGMCWLATARVLYLFDCATYSPAVSMRFDSSSCTFTSVVQAPLGNRTSYHSPERSFPTDPVWWNELRRRALHEIGPWTH